MRLLIRTRSDVVLIFFLKKYGMDMAKLIAQIVWRDRWKVSESLATKSEKTENNSNK